MAGHIERGQCVQVVARVADDLLKPLESKLLLERVSVSVAPPAEFEFCWASVE